MISQGKDFTDWNVEKMHIQEINIHKSYSEGEIWWCSLGINIGSEQDGVGKKATRPVFILKEINKQTCYIVPLTTSKKEDKYRIHIGKINDIQSMANMSQIRLIDTKRLIKKITNIDPCMFLYIRETARNLF